MSKKKHPEEVHEDESRRSRKEVLIAKKEAEQTRGIRVAIGVVLGLILLIVVIAIVNELIISPNREVASVGNEKISLNDFQDRVGYERAQRIIFLERQLEALNNDVGVLQQFASQWIIDLLPQSSDDFGETVLTQMVDEVLIEQAAAERGIEISDVDIDAEIGADFGYYGGGLPTPLPTATETVVPTPSLTPIPTAVITDLLPTATSLPDPTVGPTSTPFPTATPVSEEAFQTEFTDYFQDFRDFGITEAQYREGIRARLLRERVMDALAAEEALPAQADHVNFFVIAATDAAESDEIVSLIEAEGFLTVWNEIRSRPFDPESTSTAIAAELLQRSQADLAEAFGEDVATATFDLDVDVPSGVLTAVGEDGTQQYFIIMVSGREELPLAESTLQAQKEEMLVAYLAEMRQSNAEIGNLWRGRVPTIPVLDPKFMAQPTATPSVIQPEVTVAP
ncbi:MAG: SurA N-terminal domain-containing protein [Anaerolineae bacterium]|nr:SurA N-terminal domain-containing protein [Anaerolineae bacterium]